MATSAPPPSYGQVMGQMGGANFGLSFVDFKPQMLKSPGFVSSPKYERFDVLLRRANEWLQRNPAVKVRTCESIEVKCKPTSQIDIDTIRSTFTEWGAMSYIRCLRLWIVPKSPSDPPHPQQIGCINAMPNCTDAGGFISQPKFESFGQTVQKVNEMLQKNPLPGRILNIETQDMKFRTWGNDVDPDKSYWWEGGKETVFYLNVLRVFYESGPPAYEEIGCADFVPDRVKEDGFFKTGDFEPLHYVVRKARSWAQSQPGLNVVSVQSIDYKLKQSWGGEQLNTQRSMYYELGKGYTFYVRIVRLSYTISRMQNPENRPPVMLSYRTFMPYPITVGGTFTDPEYETLANVQKRVMAWIQHTGARVLSVETPTVRMYTGHQHGNTEQTYTYNPGNRAERHLYIVRVYLDGDYEEPPAEALPPPPEPVQADSECCTLL